jgi:hypothetical protein
MQKFVFYLKYGESPCFPTFTGFITLHFSRGVHQVLKQLFELLDPEKLRRLDVIMMHILTMLLIKMVLLNCLKMKINLHL